MRKTKVSIILTVEVGDKDEEDQGKYYLNCWSGKIMTLVLQNEQIF